MLPTHVSEVVQQMRHQSLILQDGSWGVPCERQHTRNWKGPIWRKRYRIICGHQMHWMLDRVFYMLLLQDSSLWQTGGNDCPWISWWNNRRPCKRTPAIISKFSVCQKILSQLRRLGRASSPRREVRSKRSLVVAARGPWAHGCIPTVDCGQRRVAYSGGLHL